MNQLVERSDRSIMRLECLGLTVQGHFVPPFRLIAGEALCLHVPSYFFANEYLAPVLTGEVAHQGLRKHGEVEYLRRPMPRRRWFGLLKDQAAADWLVRNVGLTVSEATAVLDLLSVRPNERIGRLNCMVRTLLALEAYLVRPPDVLIVATAGNDLLGTNRVFDRLAERPPHVAVLYFRTASNRPTCLPDGRCLVVKEKPEQVEAGHA